MGKVNFYKIVRFLYPYKNALRALRPAKPLGVLSRHPCRNPKPLPRGKGLSVGLRPKQGCFGCLPKVLHDAKPTEQATLNTHFQKIYRFFDRLKRASCVGGSQRNYLFFFFLLSTAVIMPTAITTTRATPQTIYIVGSN